MLSDIVWPYEQGRNILRRKNLLHMFNNGTFAYALIPNQKPQSSCFDPAELIELNWSNEDVSQKGSIAFRGSSTDIL